MTQNTNKDERRENAAAWFVRLRAGDCSTADRRSFEAWAADAGNAAAYAAVEETWSRAGAAGALPEMKALRDEALGMTGRRFPWTGVAAAGLAAIALAVGGAVFRSSSLQQTDGNRAAAVEPAPGNARRYRTAIGERSTVALADGSVVFLNTNSRLSTDYSEDTRHVELLQGQALFEVTPETERPFVVAVGDRRITALGTAFDVRLEPDRLQVTLIEGRVSVEEMHASAAPESPERAELAAGQQFVASETAGVEVREAPVGRVTSWREGRLIFEDEPLAKAVAEMNRYSTTRIVLGDPELAQLRVSGVFNTGQSRSFVEALVAYFPIAASPDAASDRITLEKRPSFE